MDISIFWVESIPHLPAEQCGIHNPFAGPCFLSCECFCSMPLDTVVLSEIYLRGTRCIFIMFEDISKMYTRNVHLCFFTKQFHFSLKQFSYHKFIEHTAPTICFQPYGASFFNCWWKLWRVSQACTYLPTYIPIIPTNCMDPRPANSQLSGDDVGNHKSWCLPTYLQLDACIFTNKNTLNATIYLIASLRYWAWSQLSWQVQSDAFIYIYIYIYIFVCCSYMYRNNNIYVCNQWLCVHVYIYIYILQI